MTTINFTRMSANGNDFIIIDGRENFCDLTPEQIREIASRDNLMTEGCDQLLILKDGVDVIMETYNADGSRAEWSGNGAKCVASLLSTHKLKKLAIDIGGTWIDCIMQNRIVVNMGKPFKHRVIDIKEEITNNILYRACYVDFKNPHCVILMYEVNGYNLVDLAEQLQKHEMFPDGTNVEIVSRTDQYDVFDVRVWERGVGITKSCGSGGGAVAWVLRKEHLIDDTVELRFEGGNTTYKIDRYGVIRMLGDYEIQHPGNVEV